MTGNNDRQWLSVAFVTNNEGIVTTRRFPLDDWDVENYSRDSGARKRILELAQMGLNDLFKNPPPMWQVGDVIGLRHNDGEGSLEYTYVRGALTWSSRGWDMRDSEVNESYREGRVRHLLRDGKPIEQ